MRGGRGGEQRAGEEGQGREELVRILVEPETSLIRQYQALLGTEGVELTFTEDGVEAIAEEDTLALKIESQAMFEIFEDHDAAIRELVERGAKH